MQKLPVRVAPAPILNPSLSFNLSPLALSPQEKADLISAALRQMLAIFDSIQKIDPTVEAHFISQERASRSYTFGGAHEPA